MCWAITGPGPGQFGLFDPTSSGACNTGSPAGTNPVYVDLAVLRHCRGGHLRQQVRRRGVDKLTPDHSILTDLLGANGYNNGHANIAANPSMVSVYANGNRKPSPFIPGFTTLIDTAATSDEGGNFIDIRYGPLTLWNCLNPDGTVKSPQSAANCPLFGNYHLAAGFAGDQCGRQPHRRQRRADRRHRWRCASGRRQSTSAPTSLRWCADRRHRRSCCRRWRCSTTSTAPTAIRSGRSWTQADLVRRRPPFASTPTRRIRCCRATPSGAPRSAPSRAPAFTLVQAPANGTSLLLKGSGSLTLNTYQNFVRVRYNAGAILVETTINGGLGYANLSTLASGVSFAVGETMAAMCDAARHRDGLEDPGSAARLCCSARSPCR